MRIILNLTQKIESQNKQKSHWSKQYRDRQEWEWIIHLAARDLGKAAEAKGPRSLTIYDRGRFDLPNVAGGAKGIIDALVKSKLLLNDHRQVLVDFRISPAAPKPGVAVTLVLEDQPFVLLEP